MLSDARRKEKEVAVYNAVLSLIESGSDLTGMTVQQVAEAAGIGKGTVYEYFPSKEKILQGAAEYCLSTELERLEALLGRCDTLDRLIEESSAYLRELCRSRVSTYRILGRTFGRDHSAPCPAWRQPLLERLKQDVEALVARMQAAHEIDPTLRAGYCGYVMAATAMSCIASVGRPVECTLMPTETILKDAGLLLRRGLCPAERPNRENG